MKTYVGTRTTEGTNVQVVIPDQEPVDLIHAVFHSPTGLEWGYGGSGPADLALSILCDYFDEPRVKEKFEGTMSWRLHQPFKRTFVGSFDREKWELTEVEIDRWIAEVVDVADVVRELAGLRSQEETWTALHATADAELAKTDQYKEVQEIRKELLKLADMVSMTQNQIRTVSLAKYRTSGEVRPAPGILVKIFHLIRYDEKKALDYAKVNLPAALKLDGKMFTDVMKALKPEVRPEFVSEVEDPKPTIAKDLSSYFTGDQPVDGPDQE